MTYVLQLDTPKHGVDLEELAELHHREFGGSRAFDRRAIARACVQGVRDPSRKYVNCWIAYDDDENKPIGYLAASMRSSFYSQRSYAVQEMWFVIPSHRGGRAAFRLLRAFEHWALGRGAERIYMQVEHDSNPLIVERTIMLMNRLGYKTQGYIAVKVPNAHTKEHDNDRGTHSELGAEQAS